MTTKPKAKRFRIRRSGGVGEASVPPRSGTPGTRQVPQEDGFGPDPFPTATKAGNGTGSPPPAEHSADASGPSATEIAAIRKEGLTGRQLRMARRLAQKHGLAPTSDFDAVRLLRKAGIDPFQRANMLQLVVADPAKPERSSNLPQVTHEIPGTELSTVVADATERRDREISEIQRDIARRRRRSLVALGLRLLAFVALPTMIAGWYYFSVATPMYTTNSAFEIQQAQGGQTGGLGGLFQGTGLASSQDSVAVQEFLTSPEAMERLDREEGFVTHFSDPAIDPIQRLDADATNVEAHKLYKRLVKVGYDPTEGILRMEVTAADPETSAQFSRALISYAEERVDDRTQRLREDQMQGSRDAFDEAEAKMLAAQERVLELQEQLGVLDPISETSGLMSQITGFELQLAEKRLQLQQLLDNRAPNQARVAGVEGDISRLEALIADMRGELTEGDDGAESLAVVSGQLRMAEADLQTRSLMMQESLQMMESARMEANRQIRYLSLSVNPVPPDEPTYPRAFENTVLALLIFSGIYLMISLTVSILREQVSG
ncbi:MAG: capsule biosynthesis protein [Pseudomonadota bacterium]